MPDKQAPAQSHTLTHACSSHSHYPVGQASSGVTPAASLGLPALTHNVSILNLGYKFTSGPLRSQQPERMGIGPFSLPGCALLRPECGSGFGARESEKETLPLLTESTTLLNLGDCPFLDFGERNHSCPPFHFPEAWRTDLSVSHFPKNSDLDLCLRDRT
jgi:hypothetical protein